MSALARPFLTVFTRHMASRPTLYAACLASLDAQECRDFEHVVALDDSPRGGRGFAWANAQFEAHRAEVHGDYVLQLDDDDTLAGPGTIGALREAAADGCPDAIVFRADHLGLGVLPDAVSWRRRPVVGHIGGGDLIVRRELWLRCLPALRSGRYAADHDFLAAVWRAGPRLCWLDEVLVRAQRVSRGSGE
jgi:glycosyltransferase involved in cell wall biosynthesis